jgi:hypothetical protein
MSLIIDYDELSVWGRAFGEVIESLAPTGIMDRLRTGQFEYYENAADLVEQEVGVRSLTEGLKTGLAGSSVRLYHGTRLTPAARANVEAEGLKPLALIIDERRRELETLFASHPDWSVARLRMDDALQKIGPGEWAGRRVDRRVHACFSRGGLLQGCSHYNHVGGEVDNHIVSLLFDDRDSALPLLVSARRSLLVTFVRPFADAMAAANPNGHPAEELPSLMQILLRAWAWGVANPGFDPGGSLECAAAWFEGPIPDVERIIEVDDGDLGPL